MGVDILRIHHLTAICSDARRTVAFYTKTLGLRLVKKTVNFDDPEAYHLYFGDGSGTPGTLVTFFEWPRMPAGERGIGTTHHLAFIVASEQAQLQWKRRLIDLGIGVTGPYNRTYFTSIYFRDPDGLILEIATSGPGWGVDETPNELGSRMILPEAALVRGGRNEDEIARTTWPSEVPGITDEMQLKGLHHITAIASDIDRTTEFYTQTLGLHLVKKTVNYDDPTAPHYYYGAGDGSPGAVVTYFGPGVRPERQGRMGRGLTHHFAFAVENDEIQRAWRNRLMKAGIPVTPVLDRIYFKSVYFSDPDGHILELATLGPGFLVDEERENLGTGLRLPPWLEESRASLEKTLVPIA